MSSKTILLALCAMLSVTACNSTHRINEYESIYAVDGDTFRFVQNGETYTVRIMGVDTPEMKGRCSQEIKKAKEAKTFTKNKLLNASNLTLTQLNRNKDKYGRLLRQVEIDGERLDKALIKANLGRAYEGGKRKSWCP